MKSSRPSFAVVAAAALVAILLTFNSPIFNSLTAAALTRNALVANALASPALDDLNGLAVEAAALLAGPARWPLRPGSRDPTALGGEDYSALAME